MIQQYWINLSYHFFLVNGSTLQNHEKQGQKLDQLMTKEEEMKQILNHMPNAYETSKSIKSKQPELADIAWWEMS